MSKNEYQSTDTSIEAEFTEHVANEPEQDKQMLTSDSPSIFTKPRKSTSDKWAGF